MAKLLMSRAVRHGGVLVLWGVLAGCATGGPPAGGLTRFEEHGPGGPPPVSVPPSRRILLAGSDGQTMRGEPTGQALQGYNVPGRNPDSQMPWEFFLGHAAHRLITYMYRVKHPQSQAFYNTATILTILEEAGLGGTSQLLPSERNLRPDITDISALCIFEIKPWNAQGLQEGRQEVQIYLVALNRAVAPEASFVGGTGFQGQILIRFAQGQYIWRLEWQTTEPGVIQYRYTRSQQRFESQAAAYEAGQWVDLSEQEMQQYGGWVGQAVDEMVSRREQLATFSAVVGFFIDIAGHGAVGFFTGAVGGRVGPRSGAQPPAQRGGQLIPFPARPPPAAPPAKVPAASGM